MEYTKFIERRRSERDWLQANGYENGDPQTNGEFATLALLAGNFSHFLDVGANRGDFVREVKRIKPGCRVSAFEPNPGLGAQIRRSLDEEAGDRLFTCALSDKPGNGEIFLFPEDDTASSLVRRSEMNPSFTRNAIETEVTIETLDHLKDQFLDSRYSGDGLFLKIDAEGHESHILFGGQELFAVEQPLFVLFEYSFGWLEAGALFRDAFHFLNAQNFQIYRLTPFGLELVPFYRRSMDDTLYCNYLAVRNGDLGQLSSRCRIANHYGETDFFPFRKEVIKDHFRNNQPLQQVIG